MRKIVFLVHISLDGFVAGPNGEMNWIHAPQELFDWGSTLTDQADTALYGRITYGMMKNYWPTAGNKTNASKHDREHSAWYNQSTKIVVSKTLPDEGIEKTIIIRDRVAETIREIKQQPGKNIQIYGSPSVIQELLNADLIDEFYVSVNPVILGKGKPLFHGIQKKMNFHLVETKTFPQGVVLLHYEKGE
ncbi:MAG: dihydrofolate reductase family protein [archaeon]